MQPVWDDYSARPAGVTPFNAVDDIEPVGGRTRRQRPADVDRGHSGRARVAADLRRIALMDGPLARVPITGGASIYPFCWSILLSAHSPRPRRRDDDVPVAGGAGGRAAVAPARSPRPRGDDLPRRARTPVDPAHSRTGRELRGRRPLRRRAVLAAADPAAYRNRRYAVGAIVLRSTARTSSHSAGVNWRGERPLRWT